MANTAGRFKKVQSPKVEVGQFWMDKNGTVRRVVAPLDDWEVHFARVADGYRSRVQRVSRGGAPSAGYTFVPKSEPQENPVHIRRALAGGESSETFCGLPAEGLITTTLRNLSWWKRRAKNSKVLEICFVCLKRNEDGTHAALERAETAEVAA